MNKALLLTLGIAAIAATTPAQGIHWSKTLAVAMSEAKANHKIVMIDFYTDWCHWCKVLDEETYPDQQVGKVSDQTVCVRVNAEKEGKEAAGKYGVHGYPTILFVSSDGAVLHKVVGFMPPADFADEMKLAMQANDLADLLSKAQAGDAGSISFLVRIYASRDDETKMAAWLNRLHKADPQETSSGLGPALNAVGDYYLQHQKAADALTFFQQSIKATREDRIKAHALLFSSMCYQSKQDKANANSALKEFLKLPNQNHIFVDMAKEMLAPTGKS